MTNLFINNHLVLEKIGEADDGVFDWMVVMEQQRKEKIERDRLRQERAAAAAAQSQGGLNSAQSATMGRGGMMNGGSPGSPSMAMLAGSTHMHTGQASTMAINGVPTNRRMTDSRDPNQSPSFGYQRGNRGDNAHMSGGAQHNDSGLVHTRRKKPSFWSRLCSCFGGSSSEDQ